MSGRVQSNSRTDHRTSTFWLRRPNHCTRCTFGSQKPVHEIWP